MSKKAIYTKNAPDAVGPYSQAVSAGSFLFTSGQIPLDPATGRLVEGDIKVQTAQVFKNLEAVLKEDGMTFDNVVKTNVYLADIADFNAMNEVYSTFFKEPYPARSAVQVAALPKGAALEIECICVR